MAETADSSFMSPELVSLMVQMGPTIYQGMLGRKQAKEAEKLRSSLVRPEMPIQPGYQKALGMAEQAAGSRYMSNQRAVEQGIEQSGADLLGTASQSATSTGDMQAILKKVSEDISKAKGNLGMQAASDYEKRQLALQQMYQTMGGLEQTQWDYNTKQKFGEDAAATAALEGASYTNKARALQGFGQAAGQFLASDAAHNMFKSFGSGARSRENTLNKIDTMNALSGSVDDESFDPVGYVASPGGPTDSQMLDITGMRSTDLTTQQAAADAARRDMMAQQAQFALGQRQRQVASPSSVYQQKMGLTNDPFMPYTPPAYTPGVGTQMPSSTPGMGSKMGMGADYFGDQDMAAYSMGNSSPMQPLPVAGFPAYQSAKPLMKNNTYANIYSNLIGGAISGMNQYTPPSPYGTGNITGQMPGNQVPPSGNPYQNQMGVFGQTPSSLFDIMNQISLGIRKY